MNPSAYIEYLQNTLELPELALDEEGCCILTFDNMPVSLQSNNQGFIMTSYVAQLDSPPDAELLKQLLASNLYWQASKGCTLALEPETLSVVAQIQTTEEVAKISDQLAALVDVTEQFGMAINQYEERRRNGSPATQQASQMETPPLNKA